jgi:glycosyltransferase involved in cell wall biosynthesis
MKVWVVKTSEMLASDNRNGRLMRSGIIAHMLDARGHEVTWWMSSFDHANRRSRCAADASMAYGSRGTIRMLHSPGYRASVSLARFADHVIWGRRFERAIAAAPVPDLIFCAYPTIESALICARYARRHRVPVIVDLRDMWPDLFAEVPPRSLRPLARVLLAPLRVRAAEALRTSTALFAITDEFLQWGLGLAGRERTELDAAFAQAYPLANLQPADAAEAGEARQFWDQRGISREGAFNVVLIGSITGRRVEMDAVLAAARTLQHEARPVRFVFAGDGDDLELYRARARDCPNVLFSGWLRVPLIRELLVRSHLGLVPYRNTPDYIMSVPTKAAEYFAAGVPVATSLRGTLPRLLRERRCGMQFDAADPDSLVALVRALRDEPARQMELGANAERTFRSEFVAETVYARLIDRLETIALTTNPQLAAAADKPAVLPELHGLKGAP